MSDYGDMCREIREARRDARAKHGVPCPICVEKLPKAQPSILLMSDQTITSLIEKLEGVA